MVKRVLVVDDEPIIADALAAILRNAGYEARVAYDAISALPQCEAWCPDLVITDVVMWEMNGIELAMQIKQRHPSSRILLFSGQSGTAHLLEEARGRGYDFELLTKPIHPGELLKKIAA